MTVPRGLHTLARLHGIQTAYRDNDGRRVTASPVALLATLRALGVETGEIGEGTSARAGAGGGAGRGGVDREVADHLAERREELLHRTVPPVVVAWAPRPGEPARGLCRVRTASALEDRRVRLVLRLEGGGERIVEPDPAELESEAVGPRVAGSRAGEFVDRHVPLDGLPIGYHRLHVEVEGAPAWNGGRERAADADSLLIAAPRTAAGWDVLPGGGRPWGVFAPLYGLWRGDGDSAPGYGMLAELAERAAARGASVVGTLPLLAGFLDEPYDPSPYAPVSRLFWNAAYVEAAPSNIEAVPSSIEAAPSSIEAAPSSIEAAPSSIEAAPSGLRHRGPDGGGRVALREVLAARRPALEGEARALWSRADRNEAGAGAAGRVPREIAAFIERNPLAVQYARFRAATEARGTWDGWPERLRRGELGAGDVAEDVVRYHLYAQWRAEQQLEAVAERAAAAGAALYLDLPLGVHRHGFDTWRAPELFALDASAGAPPDPLALDGQDWGFPPIKPEASRRTGHRYFRDSIRHHLRHAGVLRIDHVMQLHRMYWVPAGDARDGVYVRYPAEELWAVVCLESRRADAVVVGEDLGTVPRGVRRAMKRHGVPGMYVGQFELTEAGIEPGGIEPGGIEPGGIEPGGIEPGGIEASPSRGEGLVPRAVPEGALASIGTHDTPTFAGWWWGQDIRIRRDLGQVDAAEAEAQLAGRRVMREKLVRGVASRLHHRAFGIEAAPSGAGSDRRSGSSRDAGVDRDTGGDPDPDPDHAPDAGDPGEGRGAALEVQAALLRRLGRSPAGLVLATLEDLWLEEAPQNVPGTTRSSNWSRRLARPLEALWDGEAAGLLAALDEARRDGGKEGI